MLLTITTTARPATDLGYLLVKHPGRVQAFEQSFGTAHVFYPEAEEDRCTAALLLDVDPIKLAKTRKTPDFSLGQYVNDRSYAASSLLASAMAGVFRTAMRGHSADRPQLAETPIPLRITLPALPCRGGPEVAASLFEPLGWHVDVRPIPLDERFPEWGDSRYVTLTIEGELTLSAALNQLYVLLPVLDDSKHYWIAADEVDKLVRAGEGWLAAHPARAAITRRYLANRRGLVRTALARLADADDTSDDALDRHPIDEEPPVADPTAAEPGPPEDATRAATPPVPLAERRIQAVLDVLRAEQASTVIDLGCGSGRLLSRLLQEPYVQFVAGTDVSTRAMVAAQRRLDPLRLPRAQRDRLGLFSAALTYANRRRPRLPGRVGGPARRARLRHRTRRARPGGRRRAPARPYRRVPRRPGRPRPGHPGVLRLAMGMVRAGTALCVPGNHENKLTRALKGRRVTVSHGLAESLEQLGAEPEEFRAEVLAFVDGLVSHLVLDDGRLVVAHAGLKEAYQGRASGRVRSFAG